MYTINTPRVEECIGAVMARHNGTSEKALGKYFEEVHQHLAPLARDLERENVLLRNALEHIAGSCEGRAAEIARAALMGPNVEVQRDSGGIIAGGSAGTTGCASKVAE